MRRPTLADGGFQHIAGPANRVAEQVANAVIQQAEQTGDPAVAERLRCCLQDFTEGRI
jgi:hypothetical protein